MSVQQDQRTASELYDHQAGNWTRTAPSSLSDFTARPPVLELCKPYQGSTVLDLGCGEGYCARTLRDGGAAEVLGIDVSSRMIEAAKAEEQRNPKGIRYRQGDATDLHELADASFDRVLAMFLFNYLTTTATQQCLREVARILRPGGKFVFAVPHPSLPWLRKPAPPFYFDVGSTGYFQARDTRWAGKIWKRDGTELEVQLVHKTLEDYFAALRGAGFNTMPLIRELRVTPEILSVDPKFFGPLGDVPLHLAVSVER
ncbi:MAG TPA: class I SAM-dependent methyltransferase [Polyangiales bacterium]|nr:class I SAM-dependent methyltransferase [Polyangiales bacterium]